MHTLFSYHNINIIKYLILQEEKKHNEDVEVIQQLCACVLSIGIFFILVWCRNRQKEGVRTTKISKSGEKLNVYVLVAYALYFV